MLYGMVGRAEVARAAMRQARTVYRELGLEVWWGASVIDQGSMELYLRDHAAAERVLTEGMDVLEQLGERGYRSTAAAVLAQALNELARYAEAEKATRLSEELASPDDTPSQIGWRTQRARALAHRGEVDEAERLAREAVALAEPTDAVDSIAECAIALAEVLDLAGRSEEAAEAARRALEIWERKGIVAYVERARTLLAELQVAK
jgi:tetratricopeptide (TPR) repeat protein